MIGKQRGIMVDLDRCVGCYACEVACKQENNVSLGTPWIRIKTVGPEVVNGKLRMDHIPVVLEDCDFCQNRGMQPSCVVHCPTEALRVCDPAMMLDALSGNKRYQLCTIK